MLDRTGAGKALRWDVVAILGAFSLVVGLHLPALERLLRRWLQFDAAYSHGLFVFAASLFLIYRVLRRHRFSLQPSLVGMGLAAVTAVAIALADVINILILQQLGAVFLWWAICLAVLGWPAAARLAVPIGFLYYAIPIWDYLTRPLVNAAVVVNDSLLGLMGIHFHVEGVFIYLLDVGTFEIADGCSGLRYLVVALTLSTLFSALNFSRLREWLMLHAFAIVLALMVNWVRIFIIILAGYETEMQSPLVAQHELFGWVVFALALLPFFYIANRLANRVPATTDSVIVHSARHYSVGKIAGAACAAVIVTVMPALVLGAIQAQGEPRMIEAPEEINGFQRTIGVFDALWNPDMRRTDQVVREVYRHPDDKMPRLDLGIWYYANQGQDHELVQFGNRVIDPGEWRIERQQVNPAEAEGWTILELSHRYLRERRVVAMTYFVAGERVPSGGLTVKATMLRQALSGRRDGALVTLTVRCESEEECAVFSLVLREAVKASAMSAVFRG